MKEKYQFKKSALALLGLICFTNCFSQAVSYKYDQNGNRYQRIMVCVGCNRITPDIKNTKDSSEVKQAEIEGAKIAMQYGVSVFPNPSKDLVHVVVNKASNDDSFKNSEAMFYLFDNNGRILSSQKKASVEASFDLSIYKSGVYYIRVLIKDENLYYKVIKSD